MSVEKKLLGEIERYKKINYYILEQEEVTDLPPLDGEETTEPTDDTLTSSEEVVEPVDIETDPDVEVVGDETTTDEVSDDSDTEELDVTELVTTQKDMSDKQEEYMETMFSRLE